MDTTKLNVAIIHDSLTQFGGAERVLEAFHEMFPKAPVFVLVLDKSLKENYKTWDIRTSFLQFFYNFFPKLQYFLPLIPFAVSSFNFSGYDFILSSSSGFVKNIKVPKKCIHINYCHTPARFLWTEPEYVSQETPFLLRPIAKLCIKIMKKWDHAGSGRVDYFVSNSLEVQKRIKKIYNRNSEVIYPFVDINFWKPTTEKKDYFLLAGRLQAHKNNDLIVRIFNELDLPLHIVGTGRQEKFLKSIANDNIKFFGKISDIQLRDEYSGALGYIYPQVEDLGLMPLEAAACGTGTLAYARGGSLETIVDGVTGKLMHSRDVDDIKKTIINWDYKKYSVNHLRVHAEGFAKNNFILNFKNFLLKTEVYENSH